VCVSVSVCVRVLDNLRTKFCRDTMSVQLLCADVCPEMVPLARADRAILDDSRVLSQLLRTEMHSVPSVDYFDCKSELQPYMRRVVTTWMLEVCYANETHNFCRWILCK
jgi:hypothetical protein